ncbi:hypothetical protein [Portibacter lacus]|uniref:Glycosyltransferase RgtA/B/C/D-like domain-containing protein n=1 Tax=Portibacter lacus TaxID=1099794 RepID=A0AA37SM82_9BACT|nr:hypothetical protein [Portibacter lacus]GLR17213.1 hypothetical protein GCM10007940_18280 [Portibacter lacus]
MKFYKDYKFLLSMVIGLFYLAGLFVMDNWKGTMRNGDSSGYYIHAVSGLLHQDVGDYSKTIASYLEHYPKSAYLLDDPFWMKSTSTGKKYIKYSIGVAVMEAPAFFAAHLYSMISGYYKADGFSPPYIFAINAIQVVYIAIGFYLLAFVLAQYYSKSVVIATLLCIALGTNLFIQATYLTIAHTFLFFNFCWLIYLSFRFYKAPTYGRAALIGLVVGLIALIRVPEILSFFIPLFWGVYNKDTLLNRVAFFRKNVNFYLLAALVTALVFFPQLYYWYFVSGEWLFNPYGGEGFNFLDPHIIKGWFSYKNGWLVYTPIMIFSLIGLFFIKNKARAALLPLLLFVGLNSYVHYSYYTWNYFPGMGSRPMIESYPLLAFSFAAFLAFVFRSKITKYFFSGLLVLFIGLNLLQSWQFRQGILWTARSSKAFYWEVFGQLSPDRNSLRAFDSQEFQPDLEHLRLIKTLYLNDFEQEQYKNASNKYAKSGNQSLLVNQEFPDTLRVFNLGEEGIKPEDYIYLSVQAYRERKMDVKDRDGLESLVLRIYDENRKEVKWTNIKIASHIDNEENKIGSFHGIEKWDEAGFFIKIPNEANDSWSIDALIWNPNQYEMYIDDFQLKQYRKN